MSNYLVTIVPKSWIVCVLLCSKIRAVSGFVGASVETRSAISSSSSSNGLLHTSTLLQSSSSSNNNDEDAAEMKQKAEELREQIRRMEETMGAERQRRQEDQDLLIPEKEKVATMLADVDKLTLKNKKVLVVGANGRLGSMVCRYLLRSHPEIEELVAAVHVVGENSNTGRGYGRLSYEVGAEDGRGSIGAAWMGDETYTQSFQYDDETMSTYNLNKLRIVEVELLDPVQCDTIVQTSGNPPDCVIWCATDFNANTPRAVSGLNVAFLFRAIADPQKGRVEIEGLQNMLNSLTKARKNAQWTARLTGGSIPGQQSPTSTTTTPATTSSVASSSSTTTEGSSQDNDEDEDDNPLSFVLVSPAPEVLGNFETPFGEFNAIKRQGEEMLLNDYPSLGKKMVVQMGRYDDNFVEEGQQIQIDEYKKNILTNRIENEIENENDNENNNEGQKKDTKYTRRINRRDAAKFAVDALTDPSLVNKKVRIWTKEKGDDKKK